MRSSAGERAPGDGTGDRPGVPPARVSAQASAGRRGRPAWVPIAVTGACIVAVGLVAVALAAVPLASSGRFDLVGDVFASAVRGGAIPHPAATPNSGTAAIDLEPSPGVRVIAPAGALDKPRTMKMAPLPASKMAVFDGRLRSGGVIPLGGYAFDAGMSGSDLFRKPVTVSFDLASLHVPRQMWDQMSVAYVADDGAVSLMTTRLDGQWLVFETRHNGTLLPILVPILVGVIDYGWKTDRAGIPKGDFASLYWKPGQARYRVLYPKSWPAHNPAEVARVEARYKALLGKHKLSAADVKIDASGAGAPPEWIVTSEDGKLTGIDVGVDPFSGVRNIGTQIAERLERLKQLAEDPEYKALSDKVRDETWLKENYLPVKVANTVTALDRGYEYLDSRGFRKPGVAKFSLTFDVYIVDESLGPELPAETRNAYTTSPFIVVDGTKVPAQDMKAMDPEAKKLFDDLQLTAMHEMFHVVQAAYVLYDDNRNLWFTEATALVLEREATDYYTKAPNNFAQTWPVTQRFYESFFDAMTFFDPGAARPNQQHGYGESYFLEFLRDAYFTTPAAKQSFLPKLMEDYASVRSGTVESLYRTTGGTPESLSKMFYAFSYAAAGDLLLAFKGLDKKSGQKLTATIDAAHPVYDWGFEGGLRPLSARILQVDIPGLLGGGPARPTDPVYVVSTNGMERYGVATRLAAPGTPGAWDEVKGGAVLPRVRQMHLMRVETYVTPPKQLDSGLDKIENHGPFVFGMFRAKDPPTAQVKNNVVTIDWPPSAAAQLKKDNGEPVLISGYRVTVTTPDGARTTFASNKPHVELPVPILMKLIDRGKQATNNQLYVLVHQIGAKDFITLKNMWEALSAGQSPKLKVSYEEVAAVPGSPVGPPSPEAQFQITDEARVVAGVTGIWAGSVPFSGDAGEMRYDLVETSGGNFDGTLRFQGTDIPVKGSWNPATQSWTMEMRESHLWYPMVGAYLQKLPGDRIYSFAPPALLTRRDTRRPELGWTHDPADIEWQQFLRMLSKEAKQSQKKAP